MEKIKAILAKYAPEDKKIFSDTVEMLCKKGVGNGVFQDYGVLSDVIELLYACADHIEKGNN